MNLISAIFYQKKHQFQRNKLFYLALIVSCSDGGDGGGVHLGMDLSIAYFHLHEILFSDRSRLWVRLVQTRLTRETFCE